MEPPDHRPEGARGHCDRYLPALQRELSRELVGMFRRLTRPTLHLPPGPRQELAALLVEFAEDLHCNLGIWLALEDRNREFFGTPLPFLVEPGEESPGGIGRQRTQHLLWGLYAALLPDLILSPTHADLALLAEMVTDFLAGRFAVLPTDSGIGSFLQTPNTFGWDVKRKLLWLGRHSYLFRTLFRNYVGRQDDGESIATTDDFVCQETTIWSGLGVVDTLAGTLGITPRLREDLRGWYERHMAYYRVTSVHGPSITVLNLVSDRPYAVRIGVPHGAKFQVASVFAGSLVPWNGEWYMSGAQQVWPSLTEDEQRRVKADFLQRLPTVAYRYCKDLAKKALQSTRRHHDAFCPRTVAMLWTTSCGGTRELTSATSTRV